jgi:trehalose 6-phosphate synthase/phosphatase
MEISQHSNVTQPTPSLTHSLLQNYVVFILSHFIFPFSFFITHPFSSSMPRIPTTPGIDTDIIKSFLPFAGEDKPAFHGKVINVTHYIQYSCVKKSGQQEEPTVLEKLKKIVPGTGTQTTKVSPDDAPISRLQKRRQTQITIGESTEWKLIQRGGHSAMYSGLEALKKAWDCVYIGSPGPLETEDGESIATEDLEDSDKETIKKLLKDAGDILPIFLDSKVSAGHYEGYCKKGE